MPTQRIKVGSARVTAGAWSRGKLRVATYPDGRSAYIPVLIAAGSAKQQAAGPRVALITGAHGDEINGPELVERLIKIIKPREVRGVLVVLPLMNPWGFAERSRFVPIDQRDLNRSYPGHPHGSFSYQVAHQILEQVVRPAAYTIDVHDAGTRQLMLPHPRVHLWPVDDETRALGRAFGSDIMLLRNADPGMLAGEARALHKKNVISVEVGGAFRIWEQFQRRALQGLLNMLRFTGTLSGKQIVPRYQYLLERRRGIPAELTGIQTTWVELGQVITPGQLLYRIYNPLTGQTVVHRATQCGVVLSKNVIGRVDRGQDAIALLDFRSCDAHALLKTDIIHNRTSDQLEVGYSGLPLVHRYH